MAEKAQQPSIMHKVEGTLLLQSPKTLGARSVLPHTKDASTCCKATQDLSMFSSTVSPVFVEAPSEKGLAGFLTDFIMGGVSAAVSKTAAAPIERMMLLIQNQDEMLKTGRLSEPYKGIGECFSRTVQSRKRVFGSFIVERKHCQCYPLLPYSAKKGGERQFNCLVDVYRKTLQSDGVAGLYLNWFS